MKIRKLHLKNIGVFDDEEINFQECPAKDKAEIHILTGENGTGKTTILQALAYSFDNINDTLGEHIINPRNSFYKKFKYFGYDQQSKLSKVAITFHNGEGLNMFRCPTCISSIHYYTAGFVDLPSDFSESIHSKLYPYRRLINNYSVLSNELTFAAFAFSGYRRIESESVQANVLPKGFNPLAESLSFIKNYHKEGEITINQLVANNISNRALSKEDGSLEESKRYETVINSIETFIKDVTDYEVKFVLKRSPNELKIRIHGEELDFDVLPDGLRSLISWIADLLGRVDLLKWQDDLPITEKNLILLLDEIEVHLHPAWQRKVLPIVQKLFKNSQIFVSTHSPFVVNSVDDAWVYKLKVENGKAKVASVERSEDARSYRYVLRNTFDIENEFGIEIENRLKDFFKERDSYLQGNGNSKKAKIELKKIADELSKQSKELKSKIDFELFQLSEITGEDF